MESLKVNVSSSIFKFYVIFHTENLLCDSTTEFYDSQGDVSLCYIFIFSILLWSIANSSPPGQGHLSLLLVTMYNLPHGRVFDV